MLDLAKSVPGPPALPLVGNALLFMVNPKEQLKIVNQLLNKYGDYVKFWLGPDLNICVKNPADIRFLLTSNKVTQKGPVYEFFKSFVGHGILSGGKHWKAHRKIVMPSYNKKAVNLFSTVFNKEAEDLAKVLSQKDPHQTFNVYFDVVHCTTQSVCQTLMGLTKEESLNVARLREVMLETHNMYQLIHLKMTRWWLHIPIIYYLSGRKRIENKYIKMTEDLSSDILQKRKNALKHEVTDENSMNAVDRLILEGLDEKEIKLEVFTLFTTSQEASAKIVAGVLLFLAHLPEWQEKVYDEILATVGFTAEVTDEHLKNLHYLDMVYKEVLRYLAIGAMIQRSVEKEITINNGKITLPVKTSLVIPIHELHRDSRYWDEPNKVKPERFMPENVKKRDPNAFVPFSLGPMDCLGRVYATKLIKTIVVQVIRQLKLEADGTLEELELDIAISVKFAKGYNIRAKKRNNDATSA
ncbi:cytochrome P450 [Danaus plexippus plexippus]|uniref:Cytochrome P450 n=1 Tax=Danaus plexippus plexippus TaxID=278856 RepID=A0A212FN17_DANPL|nr:cytochrome P450 [Danaus plexippus plexippus]